MSKIAIFYMIGQYSDNWKSDFYDHQINLLKTSGLHDQIQFIDIFVKGTVPIIDLPEKVNNVTYLGELEEDRLTNKKLYRAYNYIQQRIWHFSQANPDYKILFFHSLGVSHTNELYKKNKHAWRRYLETLLIENWQTCIELLDYYDCVGSDYTPTASYANETITISAPHYQGFFWWANSNYIKSLDPTYFFQNVIWQSWLCELWIGTGNPKAYSFFNSNLNHYLNEINPPYESILKICHDNLDFLKKNNRKII